MPYGKSPNKMGHKDSAMKMGHSPLEGHCMGSAAKMESAKQEKYNLMHDNPVAKHASGSWMSKHSKSALHMGHSPAEMGHDSPAKFVNPSLIKAVGGAAIKSAGKKIKKAVKKVAKKVKEDMTGGFEHARKRRQMRGGK